MQRGCNFIYSFIFFKLIYLFFKIVLSMPALFLALKCSRKQQTKIPAFKELTFFRGRETRNKIKNWKIWRCYVNLEEWMEKSLEVFKY